MSVKLSFWVVVFTALVPLAAQVTSALPADRLAFANQLAKRGLHAEALKEYEALKGEKDVQRDELLFRLAEAYRNVGRKQDALAAYGLLLKESPASRYVDYARLNRAILRDGPERTGELKELDHEGAAAPVRAAALYYLGETAEAAKDVRHAVDYYTRAASLAPTNDVARLARLRAASVLSASENPADRRKAQAAYLDLAASPDRKLAEESLFFAGMMSYREGRQAEAAALFRRLFDKFKDSARAREAAPYAAWANHLAGRHKEALSIAAALRSSSGSEDAHYIVASSLRSLGRRKDAVDAYDLQLKAFPEGRYANAAWSERLSTLAAAGEHRRVLNELSTRRDVPEDAYGAWGIGCEAAMAMTNFPLAVEYARRAAKDRKSPQAPEQVHRLAWLLEKTGGHAEAAAAYRSLAAEWPKVPLAAQALYQAGMAEARAGRPEQARSDWTRLLVNYPESPFAPEALYARAMEELRAKEFRAADSSLDELATRFPKAPKRAETLYWWGVAARGAGDAPESERHLRDALAASPSPAFKKEITLELAEALRRRDASTEAAEMMAGLLGSAVVDRLPPAELAWLSETLAAATNAAAALKAAELVEARRTDATWNQIGAQLAGAAHEMLGERDAAAAAYARALAADARTDAGAKAALALGRIETAMGRFDEAKEHLSDAVARARAKELAGLRVQAYVSLAENEEERGDSSEALGYYMLAGTLFDDPDVAPHALSRAAAILRAQGKAAEADKLLTEKEQRYPRSTPKGERVSPSPRSL